MRCPLAAVVLLSCACESGAERTVSLVGPRPDVPVVVSLAAGTAIRAELTGVPDEAPWRAALVWWREALRQSAQFDVMDDLHAREVFVVRLAIDPGARSVAAFAIAAPGEQALAGGSFADGNLPAAIDRLAWAARIALGEDAEPPVPTALCVSADPQAVNAIEDGQALLRDGAIEGAKRAFVAARMRDGGSPFVLDVLANIALLQGDPVQAERLCREALGYAARLSPMTQHRLARTLLLARSSLRPADAERHDRELLALGEAMQRERPYDPQGALSTAIAHNFLGEFARSRPLLERLLVRLPQQAVVSYHLGWACLATGAPEAAGPHFEMAALRLPMPWAALPLTIPRAIAIYEAGDHAALEALLARLVEDSDTAAPALVHEWRRMQAAHALLQNDLPNAAECILTDFRWLLAHPSVLENRAGEFAEQGEVLVRFGRAEALGPLLAAFQGQHPGTAVADACAYLGGLVEVATHHRAASAIEKQLAHGGDSVWSSRLAAFGHEQQGEIADMHTALARAARLLSSTPMTKALLARSLKAMGQTDQATALQQALRAEMTTLHLRRAPLHPLLGPELAFAYRAF